VPSLERKSSSIREFHSSGLREPSQIAGRNVVVAGSGTSAYDLFDLFFLSGAGRIACVYRSLKWMIPTRGSEYRGTDMRLLARQQMLGASIIRLNGAMNELLRRRYQKAGIREIPPDTEFDFESHQIIPGRSEMIRNFPSIERHRGEVVRIEDKTVHVSVGSVLEADLLLWGTGYEMNLRYFEAEALAKIRHQSESRRRCGSLFRSTDAPNFYFLAPAVLATSTSRPGLMPTPLDRSSPRCAVAQGSSETSKSRKTPTISIS